MNKATTLAFAGVASIMAGAAACGDETTNNILASCGAGTVLDPGTNTCVPVDGGGGSAGACHLHRPGGDA